MRISMRWTAIVVGAAAAIMASAATPATADGPANTSGCSDGKPWYRVTQSGPATYAAIGDPTGLYNDSPKTATLSFQMEITTVRATKWEVSAGASLGWGIAQVEAKTSYNVSKESIKKQTKTVSMPVPGKRWGVMAPKVQYRTFKIDQMKTVSPCKDIFIKTMGKLKAITINPLFSTCVSATECKPKP